MSDITALVNQINEIHSLFPQAEDIPPMLRKEKTRELRILREKLAQQFADQILRK